MERVKPPDRREYQRQMSQFHDKRKRLDTRRTELLGTRASTSTSSSGGNSGGQLSQSASATSSSAGQLPTATETSSPCGLYAEAKRQLNELRNNRLLYKIEYEAADKRFKELEQQRRTKQDLLRDIEGDGDLLYKEGSKLDKRLNHIKAAFQRTTTTNLKEEKRFVDEIDRLERNRAKLPKYIQLRDELRAIENECRSSQEVAKAHRRDYRKCAYQLQGSRGILDKYRAELDALRHQHKCLFRDRHALIEQYNAQATEYRHWREQCRLSSSQSKATNKPHNRRSAAARKNSHQSDGYESEADEVILEPFHEEKHKCRYLLSYLQSLYEASHQAVEHRARVLLHAQAQGITLGGTPPHDSPLAGDFPPLSLEDDVTTSAAAAANCSRTDASCTLTDKVHKVMMGCAGMNLLLDRPASPAYDIAVPAPVPQQPAASWADVVKHNCSAQQPLVVPVLDANDVPSADDRLRAWRSDESLAGRSCSSTGSGAGRQPCSPHKTSSQQQQVNKQLKLNRKKSLKRPEQSIIHTSYDYGTFAELNLRAPATYSQVPDAIEHVEELLMDLQNRTQIEQSDLDQLNVLYSTAHSVADSGTYPSTYDMSISSTSSITGSITSPDRCSVADEPFGMGSAFGSRGSVPGVTSPTSSSRLRAAGAPLLPGVGLGAAGLTSAASANAIDMTSRNSTVAAVQQEAQQAGSELTRSVSDTNAADAGAAVTDDVLDLIVASQQPPPSEDASLVRATSDEGIEDAGSKTSSITPSQVPPQLTAALLATGDDKQQLRRDTSGIGGSIGNDDDDVD